MWCLLSPAWPQNQMIWKRLTLLHCRAFTPRNHRGLLGRQVISWFNHQPQALWPSNIIQLKLQTINPFCKGIIRCGHHCSCKQHASGHKSKTSHAFGKVMLLKLCVVRRNQLVFCCTWAKGVQQDAAAGWHGHATRGVCTTVVAKM